MTKANEITFTIDGQPFTVSDKHQSPLALLTMAGLDPDTYDLGEIRGDGEPHLFRDDQQIVVKEGADFVTVRQSAPVA